MHSLNYLIIAAAVLAEPAFPEHLAVLGGHPVLENVMLNGSGPYSFFLDTGAQANQVDARIARRLGMTPLFRGTLVTAAGELAVEGTKGIEVRVGHAAAYGQEFLFTNLDAIRTISPDLQGVLGQEFLSHFDYLLDMQSKRLVFGNQEVDGARSEFELVDGLPVIATSLGKLVLDSGADRLILFSSGRLGQRKRLVTASGLASAETSAARRLRIGGQVYGPVETVVVSLAGQHGENGLLPLSIFRSVYVSNSSKYVVLK